MRAGFRRRRPCCAPARSAHPAPPLCSARPAHRRGGAGRAPPQRPALPQLDLQGRDRLQEDGPLGGARLAALRAREGERREETRGPRTTDHSPLTARLKSQGRQRHLGSYATAEDAARAFDRATLRVRGLTSGAETNFAAAEYVGDAFLDAFLSLDKVRKSSPG